jgi:hypothetical protein
MRLSPEEKSAIVDAVIRFDPESRIYLFGLRVDDSQKGGDIDILVFSSRLTFKDKLKIKAIIFESIEEQKLDLVIARNSKDPFVEIALEKGVQLN